ncbi:MAG: GNAT family N-acetyltransferase [Anaerolineae bacterium]
MKVRIAGAGDAPERDAAAISALLFEFNGEGLDAEALARRLVEVRGLETVFLAERGREAVGLLVLRTVPTLSDAEDWAEITELYVRREARRQGVGRALMQAAIEYARRQGCAEIHLLVDPENESALAFYRATGFCQDSWEMRRRLEEPRATLELALPAKAGIMRPVRP